MAVFHFELKSDRRKGGKQTSALQHVKYINREGAYQNVDERESAKMATENRITGPKLHENAPGRELLLYSSPFGIIKQDDSGILVSRNASIQTVAIALEVAKRLYGNSLNLKGQDAFKDHAIVAASSLNLEIQFQSSFYQAAVVQQREEQEHERQTFEANGGIYGIPRFDFSDSKHTFGIPSIFPLQSGTGGISAGLFESDTERHTVTELAQTGWRLPALSGRNMVLPKQQSDMLLSSNASRQLQRRIRRRQRALPKLRWDVSGDRKNAIETSVKEILHNLQNNLDKTFASSHVQYINRESVFEQRGGCIDTGHHLPVWAKDDPKIFFSAADRFERNNGERYKELIFSLPNELNLNQQKEIVNRFLDAHMKELYYAYAIHDKIGTMSNGEHHTHIHLMFSTRQIDAAERKRERDPAVFFSRANNETPAQGGCPKSEVWNGKDRAKNLCVLREDFARIQNEVLAKYGVPSRVDHRSLKARRQEALAEGNVFLAEILNRIPEQAVGPLALLEQGNKNVLAQQKLRQMNRLREKNIFAKTFLLNGIRQAKLQNRVQEIQAHIQQLDQLLNKDEKSAMANALQELQKQQMQLRSTFDAAVWSSDAIESSLLSFMQEDEKETWQEFKALGHELTHWQDFKKSLQQNSFETPEQWQNIQAAIDQEISKIHQSLQMKAPTVRSIFLKLSEPHTKRDMLRYAGNILFDSQLTKSKLDKMILQQEQRLTEFRSSYQLLTDSLRQSPAYTAGVVADYLDLSLKQLYTEEHQLRAKMRELAKHVISPSRAISIAENLYTKGEFKQLRAAERKLQKDNNAGKLSPESLQAQQKELQNWRSRLETACKKPAAQSKIQEICAGILSKNVPHAIAYQKIQHEHQTVAAAIQEIKTQATAARHQSYQDKNQTLYKATGTTPETGYMEPHHMIGAAIAGNRDCAVLVAKNKKNFPDDWTLLSQSEREDLKNDTSKMM